MIVHDLVVIGGSLAGLSVAIQAREAGLESVLLLEPGEAVVQPEVVGQHALSVEYQAPIKRMSGLEGGRVMVETPRIVVAARTVLVARVDPTAASSAPPYPLPETLAARIHFERPPDGVRGADVLVIGGGEEAADIALTLVGEGAGVVLCLGGTDPATLSRLARGQLLRIEAERRATILWHSQPEAIEDVGGYPMVFFGDRRTPDLQFDHVIFRLPSESALQAKFELQDLPDGAVFWLSAAAEPTAAVVVPVSAGEAWERIRADRYPDLPAPLAGPQVWREGDREQVAGLREEHYNSTITVFERAHSDLWLLRVRPDRGDTSHLAGQYASLGLGYWEPRADGARDRNLDRNWDRLVRRSYSISSPMLDPAGYLVDAARSDELEFYIVLVPPSADRIPGLTPRLALKGPGDRIYLGPKVAGRYTLAPVVDPSCRVLFLATGTGEAPHNSMLVELLRKGHYGPIVSVVSVRYKADLAYFETHRVLQNRFLNYSYLPLVTREPGVEKRYVQDVLTDGTVAGLMGGSFDPEDTHVYACGNPLMIGLPEYTDDLPIYPSPVGIAQILTDAGFVLDRRGVVGNIHYEEYW
ncbi:MAG TPA: hypothetical protein VM470_09800 [Acidimicrobiia bacterium]|nr:hypothetical protein [Acidimicrobiia bacterium]